MTIYDKITDEKLKYVIKREEEKKEKYQHYHQVKLINRHFLQVKKYCHLIKVE